MSVAAPKMEPDRKVVHKGDLEALQRKFVEDCKGVLPECKGVMKEFRKRIGEAGASADGSTKSKLNFTGCKLNNEYMKRITQSLAVTPVMAKLDLSSNSEISNEGIDILLRLLQGQTKIVKQHDVDNRMSAVFLGEVNLSNISSSVSEDKLFEVIARTQCLRHANAISNIRSVYAGLKSPEFIHLKNFEKMWDVIIGTNSVGIYMRRHNGVEKNYKNDHGWITHLLEEGIHSRARTNTNTGPCLSYKEAESALMEAAVIKGLLPELKTWQQGEIRPSPSATNASASASSGNSTNSSEQSEAAAEAETNESESHAYNAGRRRGDNSNNNNDSNNNNNNNNHIEESFESTSAASDKDADAHTQSVICQITEFYAEHNPTKLEMLPTLLRRYEGREEQMLHDLNRKYKGQKGQGEKIEVVQLQDQVQSESESDSEIQVQVQGQGLGLPDAATFRAQAESDMQQHETSGYDAFVPSSASEATTVTATAITADTGFGNFAASTTSVSNVFDAFEPSESEGGRPPAKPARGERRDEPRIHEVPPAHTAHMHKASHVEGTDYTAHSYDAQGHRHDEKHHIDGYGADHNVEEEKKLAARAKAKMNLLAKAEVAKAARVEEELSLVRERERERQEQIQREVQEERERLEASAARARLEEEKEAVRIQLEQEAVEQALAAQEQEEEQEELKAEADAEAKAAQSPSRKNGGIVSSVMSIFGSTTTKDPQSGPSSKAGSRSNTPQREKAEKPEKAEKAVRPTVMDLGEMEALTHSQTQKTKELNIPVKPTKSLSPERPAKTKTRAPGRMTMLEQQVPDLYKPKSKKQTEAKRDASPGAAGGAARGGGGSASASGTPQKEKAGRDSTLTYHHSQVDTLGEVRSPFRYDEPANVRASREGREKARGSREAAAAAIVDMRDRDGQEERERNQVPVSEEFHREQQLRLELQQQQRNLLILNKDAVENPFEYGDEGSNDLAAAGSNIGTNELGDTDSDGISLGPEGGGFDGSLDMSCREMKTCYMPRDARNELPQDSAGALAPLLPLLRLGSGRDGSFTTASALEKERDANKNANADPNMSISARTVISSPTISDYLCRVRVLNLRKNWLSDMQSLGLLNSLPNVVEIDLSCNHFQGKIPEKAIPISVQRLDMSFNDLSDLTGLIPCTNLLALNLSHNSIKHADYLPSKVEILDISFNLLSSAFSLRMLALCPSVTSLALVGNPVTERVSDWKARIVMFLPNLLEVDGLSMSKGAVNQRALNRDGTIAYSHSRGTHSSGGATPLHLTARHELTRQSLDSPARLSFAHGASSPGPVGQSVYARSMGSGTPISRNSRGRGRSPGASSSGAGNTGNTGNGTSHKRGSFFGLYSSQQGGQSASAHSSNTMQGRALSASARARSASPASSARGRSASPGLTRKQQQIRDQVRLESYNQKWASVDRTRIVEAEKIVRRASVKYSSSNVNDINSAQGELYVAQQAAMAALKNSRASDSQSNQGTVKGRQQASGTSSQKRGSFFGMYAQGNNSNSQGQNGNGSGANGNGIARTRASSAPRERGTENGRGRSGAPGHVAVPGSGRGRMSVVERSVQGIYRPGKPNNSGNTNRAASPLSVHSARSQPPTHAMNRQLQVQQFTMPDCDPVPVRKHLEERSASASSSPRSRSPRAVSPRANTNQGQHSQQELNNVFEERLTSERSNNVPFSSVRRTSWVKDIEQHSGPTFGENPLSLAYPEAEEAGAETEIETESGSRRANGNGNGNSTDYEYEGEGGFQGKGLLSPVSPAGSKWAPRPAFGHFSTIPGQGQGGAPSVPGSGRGRMSVVEQSVGGMYRPGSNSKNNSTNKPISARGGPSPSRGDLSASGDTVKARQANSDASSQKRGCFFGYSNGNNGNSNGNGSQDSGRGRGGMGNTGNTGNNTPASSTSTSRSPRGTSANSSTGSSRFRSPSPAMSPRGNKSAELRRASISNANANHHSHAQQTSVGKDTSQKRGSFFGMYQSSGNSSPKKDQDQHQHQHRGTGAVPGTGRGRMSMLEQSVGGIYRPNAPNASNKNAASPPCANNAAGSGSGSYERNMANMANNVDRLLDEWVRDTDREMAGIATQMAHLFALVGVDQSNNELDADALRAVMYALSQATFFYDVKLPSSIEDVIEHVAVNKPAMSTLGKQLDQLDSLNNVIYAVHSAVENALRGMGTMSYLSDNDAPYIVRMELCTRVDLAMIGSVDQDQDQANEGQGPGVRVPQEKAKKAFAALSMRGATYIPLSVQNVQNVKKTQEKVKVNSSYSHSQAQSQFTEFTENDIANTKATAADYDDQRDVTFNQYEDMVQAIYQAYNPAKLAELDNIMEHWADREDTLIQELYRKYQIPASWKPADGAVIKTLSATSTHTHNQIEQYEQYESEIESERTPFDAFEPSAAPSKSDSQDSQTPFDNFAPSTSISPSHDPDAQKSKKEGSSASDPLTAKDRIKARMLAMNKK